MKLKWVLLLFLLPIVVGQISSYVTDHAGVLSNNEAADLERLLSTLDDQGNVQMAIYIVNSLDGVPIEDASIIVAEGALGSAKDDHGLLLFIAMDDREYRFEVGRGIEDQYPDVLMARIGREIIEPYFQQGMYFEALKSTIAIIGYPDENAVFEEKQDTQLVPIVVIIIIIFILLMIFIAKQSHSHRSSSDYFTAGYILSQIMKGGKGGSGGFGGNFGGGGSFGGGGFSGRW